MKFDCFHIENIFFINIILFRNDFNANDFIQIMFVILCFTAMKMCFKIFIFVCSFYICYFPIIKNNTLIIFNTDHNNGII